ncbi:MAG TPA: leucyl aminopeptidase [Chloroflexia bacterium]|nr:leucyl aminopeptidase [Chloroflexia bacterium]
MNLDVTSQPLASLDTDLLVIGIAQDGPLSPLAQALDAEWGGLLGTVRSEGAFKGKAYELEWLYPAPGKARRALLIGTGKVSSYDARVVRRLAAIAVRQARAKKAGRVAIALPVAGSVTEALVVQSIADGALTGLADSDLYKDRENKGSVESLQVAVAEAGDEATQALERGRKIAAAVTFGRWLGDEPANVMTPVRAAEEARRWAAECGLDCQVLGEEELREAGMGSLLSVSQGSKLPPQVVVLTYNGGGGPTLGLVGKGVTFDTGGISIKPAADMHYMKYDMCGAAAVLSAIGGIAQLGLKANVIAVAGLVENMPSGTATRPGDVVTAANGKTIEIITTDAEGRLVLADALDLARKRGAERLVDVATLTGAIKVALGDVATGAMGNNEEWTQRVLDAAKATGEALWPMPLYPEFTDKLKSNIADMMNTGGRFGGALTAGAFLQQFVGDTPWVHLDIAGTAYTEKDYSWQMKGATGAMIRTLIALAESELD